MIFFRNDITRFLLPIYPASSITILAKKDMVTFKHIGAAGIYLIPHYVTFNVCHLAKSLG